MIYGIDAVHGHAKVIGATVFPHNIGLGRHARSGAGAAGRRHHRAGD